MIASMLNSEETLITTAHGITDDKTVGDGQTVTIFYSLPNENGERSKRRYSVGFVATCRQRHSGRRCRVWCARSKHSTIELAIAAAKKLDTTTEK